MTASQAGWTDPELADLFAEDSGLEETARLLHASRPEPVLNEDFQRRLRLQLMQAANERPARAPGKASRPEREERSERRVRPPFWMRLRATHLAWGGMGVGVALAAATVVALLAGQQGQNHQSTIVATSTVTAQHLVSPNDTITVSFNQPMNHGAVESGLQIEPATQVTTGWQGNNFVITPVHHLAGNTPYTVTIAQPAVVAASGAQGTSPVQISFGTAPTPPVSAATPKPPTLSTSTLGPAQAGPLVLFAPDGGVVVNTGAATAAPSTPVPSPSAKPSPSPSPSASPSPSTSPAPGITAPTAPPIRATPTPAPGSPALVEYPAQGGSAITLGPAATAAAFSPDGSSLASVVPGSPGGSDIVLSRAHGTNRTTLTHTTSPVVAIAWTSAGRLEFATAQTISSVDGSGVVQTLASPQGTVAALSPDGSSAYLAAGGGSSGRLFTLSGGKARTLSNAGAVSGVAFSGDGSTISWIDSASSPARLVTQPVAGNDGGAAVSLLDPGSQLGTIAISHDGGAVAYTETLGDGSSKLVLADVPTGTPLATGAAASALAFSPQGDALALLQGSQVGLAHLPGATTAAGPLVPAAASQALHAFLDAQVRGDHSALSELGVPGLSTGALPSGISRASLIDAVAQPDGTVLGIASLVLDPGASRPVPLVSDETLTVTQNGASYLMSSVNASQLHQLAGGPHVASLNTSQQQGQLTVQMAFDSDLAPASVPGAISVQQPSGATAPATVSYDPNTRTATVVVKDPPSGALSVVVSTALHDINGGALAVAFTAPITAG